MSYMAMIAPIVQDRLLHRVEPEVDSVQDRNLYKVKSLLNNEPRLGSGQIWLATSETCLIHKSFKVFVYRSIL